MKISFCPLLAALFAVCCLSSWALYAQDVQGELAATLEVLEPTVEVLRANTVNWIAVKVEAIVGVGDVIRTGEAGRARVTFFADGTDTDLLPNTEYRINQFEGSDSSFQISVELLAGETTQRLSRLLDANALYEINTPSMTLTARGTEFALRVEPTGRSAMLVSTGDVNASRSEAESNVASGFGIRASDQTGLSEVVAATSFDELDAALDGCTASLPSTGDISLNVRSGPTLDFPRVGFIEPAEVNLLMGITEGENWYRIHFANHYGWVQLDQVALDPACAGLRRFADDFGPEDSSRYDPTGRPGILVAPVNTPGS